MKRSTDFMVAQYAMDAAHYFSMHAAAPEYNTWGVIAENRLEKLAEALGYTLVKQKQEESNAA